MGFFGFTVVPMHSSRCWSWLWCFEL